MPSKQVRDTHIEAGSGRVFVRSWEPQQGLQDAAVPIVLFHDSLGCVELWRDFPLRLRDATARRVIAYDRLGFGRSDPHPATIGPGFIAQEAAGTFAALREQLQLDRFVALGHSVGGGMAVACAATHSAQCEALITESAQAFVEDRTVQGIIAAKQDFARPGQVDRLRRYHGDKAEWVLRAWTETWLAPEFADWTLDDELRRVRCPLLALHGDCDEFGSVRHPERIATLSGGTAVVLENCGHVPHREHAERVLTTVARWLDTRDG